MYRVMIVEDEEIMRNELADLLQSQGYMVDTIEDFNDVHSQIISKNPQLILLDINLPNESGFSVCTKIRTTLEVPIIFVTSRDSDIDELNCIMLGGDDYITKPYNISILLARISSILRRVYKVNQDFIEFDGLKLGVNSGNIEYKGSLMELTKNEYKILLFLLRNKSKIVTRTELIEFLWDNEMFVDDNTLSVNITRLRNKLAKINLFNFIKTKHGQGYIII